MTTQKHSQYHTTARATQNGWIETSQPMTYQQDGGGFGLFLVLMAFILIIGTLATFVIV